MTNILDRLTFSNLEEQAGIVEQLQAREKRGGHVLWFAHETTLTVLEETLSDGSTCETIKIKYSDI